MFSTTNGLLSNGAPPQHLADRLPFQPEFCKGPQTDIPQTDIPMIYVMLVVTIIDPAIRSREYTQEACAGTLVKKNLVLTAASCLIHDVHGHPSEKDTVVCARNGRGQPFRATRIYLHPQYSRKEEKFNVVIVQIEKNSYSVKVLPTLPSNVKHGEVSNVLNRGDCEIGGYGNLIKLTVDNFSTMKVQNVTVMKCMGDENLICLHFENLLPCEGDVGSPILCNGELYAIFTPKIQIDPQVCLDRYGLTFTPLFLIKDFIERTEGLPNTKMEWLNNPWYILLLCGTVLAVIAGLYCCIISYLQNRFENQSPPEDPRTPENQDKDNESIITPEKKRW